MCLFIEQIRGALVELHELDYTVNRIELGAYDFKYLQQEGHIAFVPVANIDSVNIELHRNGSPATVVGRKVKGSKMVALAFTIAEPRYDVPPDPYDT